MKRESTQEDEKVIKKRKIEEKKENQETKIPEIAETFADPTLDVTFKMLFGNDLNKDILISLLNSLLGFTGHKEIVEVEINSNELPVSFFSKEKGESGITSAIDILCTNKGKQKIAIEMQGQKTKYFLPREQEYMAKLISLQVKEGEGKLYHEKVLETYIIVIGKSNIFVGDTKLQNQKLFEIDVQPMVIQTNEIIPGNKMFWKFFELPKFQESDNYRTIDKDSALKEQWLEFLIDCSKKDEEPDRSEIIKRGYEIMKVANWTPDQKALYWKQKMNEIAFLEAQQLQEEEALIKAHEAFEKGQLRGEIKGEIGKIKMALENKWEDDKIVKKLKHTHDKFTSIKEYFEQNPTQLTEDDNESIIMGELGLLDDYS
jgi:predicted transposase/invertase (TIGR01784 family)